METNRDLLRIATFILFDATVFHEALSGADSRLHSLRDASAPVQSFLDEEWGKILEIDYAPVFSLARDVLRAFPSSPETEAMLRSVMRTAIGAMSSGVLMRHDFMGRVYHRLLLRTTGHFYATYYTSVPAAWLLANLTVKTPHPTWKLGGLKGIGGFRVIDPACGSGTLLSAAYMALKDVHILARPSRLDLGRLHRVLVEKVLQGWDILDYATHLTLTTLALHSNQATVRDSNVYTLPAGVDADGVHLGSLDYLHPQQQMVGRGFTAPVVQRSLEGEREREISPAPHDLVLMNPPFSRSAKPNVKFGYSDPDARRKMNRELTKIARGLGAAGIGRAGLGAYFMLLALKLTKDDGRVGVVIPRAILSGVSWSKVRAEYLQGCEVEFIVSNYDPGSAEEGVEPWCWSENTNLGEVLIVARRTDSPPDERSVLYVNLWRKPKNEVEALLISHQAIRAKQQLSRSLLDGEWQALSLREPAVGCVYRVPQSELTRNWLAPCVFASPQLNALTLECLSDTMPCLPLASVTRQVGPDIAQVKHHFAHSPHETVHPVVWGHQAAMNTIRLTRGNVGWGQARRGATSDQLHATHASALLIAERPHLSTESLLAMRAPESVLATAFWEIKLPPGKSRAPLLVWLNSTYGILQYLACATSSMGDIFKMKKAQLAEMPVADPTALTGAKWLRMLRRVQNERFLPFGEEFARAAAGAGPRWESDRFLEQELGLPRITKGHYDLLSHDPTVVKRRL